MQNDIIKKLRLDSVGKTLLVNIPDSLVPIFDGISYDTKPSKRIWVPMIMCMYLQINNQL